MLDLIFASTAAPATILTLVMQRLLLNPEYLQMCQKQIDEVVGSGRLASLDDRTRLVGLKYLNLFMMVTYRN